MSHPAKATDPQGTRASKVIYRTMRVMPLSDLGYSLKVGILTGVSQTSPFLFLVKGIFLFFTYSLSLSKDQHYTFMFEIIFPLQCLRPYDSAKHGVWLFLLLERSFHPDMLGLYKQFCELPGHLPRHTQHAWVLEGAKLRFRLVSYHLLSKTK